MEESVPRTRGVRGPDLSILVIIRSITWRWCKSGACKYLA